jgi:ribosomal protein S18 acetylase RimI-like enzyme
MPESTGAHREVEGATLVQEGKRELAFDLNKICIQPIAKVHKRSAFVCPNETIQEYCRTHARQNNDAYKIRAFVACFEGSQEVMGYYFLALTSYQIGEQLLDDKADAKFEGSKSKAVPAVYLGMIGVHTDFRRGGIGKLLMLDAMQRTAKIAQQAGLYALTLDAIDEELIGYYRDNFGFQTFKEGATGLEMFLPIQTIMKAFPPNTVEI